MPLMVGIAGPSCSGKTSIAERLRNEENYTLIRMDNYWKDPDEFPREKGYKNWDSPHSLRLDKLYEDLKNLKDGEKVVVPVWNHGKPLKYREADPKDVIIAEGFLLFHEERIRELFDLKIYIDLPEGEILKRRLERSDEPEEREQYYRKVVLKENKRYVVGQEKYADVTLDGRESIDENLRVILEEIKNNV